MGKRVGNAERVGNVVDSTPRVEVEELCAWAKHLTLAQLGQVLVEKLNEQNPRNLLSELGEVGYNLSDSRQILAWARQVALAFEILPPPPSMGGERDEALAPEALHGRRAA